MSDRKYFAASNSTIGFKSYYQQVFGGCRRVYVIKGGPGTGKSRFFNDIAQHSREKVLYFCSSDPDSLDGVILDGNVALIDGTAPHVWEPGVVGAFEQIVNLGDFWDADALAARREEIESLSAQKAGCYDDAYAYLAALGRAEAGISKRLLSCVNFEKLGRAAQKFLRGIRAEALPRREIGLSSSLGMKGEVSFDTYGKVRCPIAIDDPLGLSWLLLGEIEGLCERRGISMRLSPDPLFPSRLDAIELPNAGVSFFIGKDGDGISMRKFLRAEAFRPVRQELRSVRAVQKKLRELALSSLAAAARAHFALEEIYGATMDFEKKEKFTADFCNRLFG